MKRRYQVVGKLAFMLLAAPCAWAGQVTGLVQFQANTPARAAEVNANFNAVAAAINDNDTRITASSATSETLLAQILANLYVPFKVETLGGICNTAAVGSANPRIIIDSSGTSGSFVVSSVLVKTSDIPATGFQFLSLNSVTINGTLFDTSTANLTGNAGGTAVLESFDLLGAPVRRSSIVADYTPGGNVPHQIVADSAGFNDVDIQLFCRTDIEDLNIQTVVVAGWKRLDETITVTYVPGR
jgi:hypothetical protein